MCCSHRGCREFLRQQYSNENLAFWCEVEDYKTLEKEKVSLATLALTPVSARNDLLSGRSERRGLDKSMTATWPEAANTRQAPHASMDAI